MKTSGKKFVTFHEKFEELKNRGEVVELDVNDEQTRKLAHQLPRHYGRDKTRKAVEDLRRLNEAKFEESPSETIFGLKRYDEDEIEAQKLIEEDRIAKDFWEHTVKQRNLADPIEQDYFQEKFPDHKEAQLKLLEDNYNAFIYDQTRCLFPPQTKEDFLYDYYLSKGYARPTLQFWKVITAADTANHNIGSKNGNRTVRLEPVNGEKETVHSTVPHRVFPEIWNAPRTAFQAAHDHMRDVKFGHGFYGGVEESQRVTSRSNN